MNAADTAELKVIATRIVDAAFRAYAKTGDGAIFFHLGGNRHHSPEMNLAVRAEYLARRDA